MAPGALACRGAASSTVRSSIAQQHLGAAARASKRHGGPRARAAACSRLRRRRPTWLWPLRRPPPGAVDYLLDALALYDALQPILGPLMADPSVTKVRRTQAMPLGGVRSVHCRDLACSREASG